MIIELDRFGSFNAKDMAFSILRDKVSKFL